MVLTLPLLYLVQMERTLSEPAMEVSPTDITKTVDAKVRSFCYFCTSPSEIRVTLNKSRFQPGDTAKIIVDCDNTQCKHDATNFEIALKRKVWLITDD